MRPSASGVPSEAESSNIQFNTKLEKRSFNISKRDAHAAQAVTFFCPNIRLMGHSTIPQCGKSLPQECGNWELS